MTENTTNVVAGAAVTSPFWLPILQNFSDISALLLPIAGLIWLLVQTIGYVQKSYKERKNERT